MNILDYITIGEREGYVLGDASMVGYPDKYVYVPAENKVKIMNILTQNNPSKRNYIEETFAHGTAEQVASLISAEVISMGEFQKDIAVIVAEHIQRVNNQTLDDMFSSHEMSNQEINYNLEYEEMNQGEFVDPAFYSNSEEQYQVEDYNDGPIFENIEASSMNEEERENFVREIEALTEANTKLEEERNMLTTKLDATQKNLTELTENNETLKEAITKKVKELDEARLSKQRLELVQNQLREKSLELADIKKEFEDSKNNNSRVEELLSDVKKLEEDKLNINQELIAITSEKRELDIRMIEKEKELLDAKRALAEYKEYVSNMQSKKEDILGVDIIREIYKTMHDLDADVVKKLLLGAVLNLSLSDIEDKDEHLTIICRYFLSQAVKEGVVSNGK